LLTAARAVCCYAQENPELEEQPERAPDGILLLTGGLLVAEIIFLMLELLQCLQVTLSMADAIITRLSKFLSQSSQWNS